MLIYFHNYILDIIMTEMIPKSSEKITYECGYALSKGNLTRHKRERTHKLLMQEKNEEYYKKKIEELKKDNNRIIKTNNELIIDIQKTNERMHEIEKRMNKILRKVS